MRLVLSSGGTLIGSVERGGPHRVYADGPQGDAIGAFGDKPKGIRIPLSRLGEVIRVLQEAQRIARRPIV